MGRLLPQLWELWKYFEERPSDDGSRYQVPRPGNCEPLNKCYATCGWHDSSWPWVGVDKMWSLKFTIENEKCTKRLNTRLEKALAGYSPVWQCHLVKMLQYFRVKSNSLYKHLGKRNAVVRFVNSESVADRSLRQKNPLTYQKNPLTYQKNYGKSWRDKYVNVIELFIVVWSIADRRNDMRVASKNYPFTPFSYCPITSAAQKLT